MMVPKKKSEPENEDFADFLLDEESSGESGNSERGDSSALKLDENTAVVDSEKPRTAAGIAGGSVSEDSIDIQTVKEYGTGKKTEDDLASEQKAEPEMELELEREATKKEAGSSKKESKKEKKEKKRQIEVAHDATTAVPLKEVSLKPTPQREAAVNLGNNPIDRVEHIKVAQERILELEEEVERLRIENEKVMSSAESLQARSDELSQRASEGEKKYRLMQESHADEKRVLQETLHDRQTELEKMRNKVSELEERLSGDLKRIRVRERELENRLELARAEHAALVRNKNEMILDLKRQMDQVAQDVESQKHRRQALTERLDDTQDRVLKAIKAIRLALTVLEGEAAEHPPLKKAE